MANWTVPFPTKNSWGEIVLEESKTLKEEPTFEETIQQRLEFLEVEKAHLQQWLLVSKSRRGSLCKVDVKPYDDYTTYTHEGYRGTYTKYKHKADEPIKCSIAYTDGDEVKLKRKVLLTDLDPITELSEVLES